VFQRHLDRRTGDTVGEVVFNTALTGYQEILTDPSYCQQIVTLTYPHIGNYGVSARTSKRRRSSPPAWSSRTCRCSRRTSAAMTLLGVPAARRHGRDRRHRHPPPDPLLRTGGAQNGCILTLPLGEALTDAHRAEAIAKAQAAPSMSGLDLAKVVSEREPYEWTETEWALGSGYGAQDAPTFHVVAYDFGVKRNILRMLASRGCRVTVVPATTPAAEVLKYRPDGIFLSNGPGDPEPCDYAIRSTRELIESGLPTFGICLGHQILALASGAKTFKMKFGHHGANHPVKDLDSGRVSITSQNHGFAVDETTLPHNLRPTHVSLFDGTLQGLARTDRPPSASRATPKPHPDRMTLPTCSIDSRI
jgi:carbamoyl-phosphate synthase small subunit